MEPRSPYKQRTYTVKQNTEAFICYLKAWRRRGQLVLKQVHLGDG